MWRADKVISLSLDERQEILDAIREVDPGYSVKWFCSHCVGQMLDKAYEILNG